MAKDYWLTFGSDPRVNTGLSPTLIIFASTTGATLAAPSISEPLTGSGYYKFSYGPTNAIIFEADGGAGLSTSDRYVQGVLDPISSVDEKVGTTGDSFGSTVTDPTTLMGYSKRFQEFMEGNATFTKSTGLWYVYSRGSSTLLALKTLTNTTTTAGKT